MATTTHMGITLLEMAQAQKEITVNEAFARIDALLNSGVVDKDLGTPPASPVEGDIYIVGPTPTGQWAGKSGQIAYFDRFWRFITPNEGALMWVNDENAHYIYNGSAWAQIVLMADMSKSVYDPASIGQQVVGVSASQTLTNKTLASVAFSGNASGVLPAHGQCRLGKVGANLVLARHNGHSLVIDGVCRIIPAAGVSLAPAGMVAGALYYIYAYMNAGTMALEASTASYVMDSDTGIRIKSGDATRTLVGMARPIAGPAWQDTVAQRFVASWFNPQQSRAEIVFTSGVTTTLSSYAELSAAMRAELVCFSQQAELTAKASVIASVNGATMYGSVGVDGGVLSSSQGVAVSILSGATVGQPVGMMPALGILGDGYHYIQLFGATTAGTATFQAHYSGVGATYFA